MSTSDGEKRKRQQPRILLGVTGSVAAVKAPEIAVRLVLELDAQVRVLLSAGGSNFWNKAKDYDKKHWDLFQQILSASSSQRMDSSNATDSFQVQLIGTYIFSFAIQRK